MHRTLNQATRAVKKAFRSWRNQPEGSEAQKATARRANMAAKARLRLKEALLAKGATYGRSVRKLESAHQKVNKGLGRLREIETLLEKPDQNKKNSLQSKRRYTKGQENSLRE